MNAAVPAFTISSGASVKQGEPIPPAQAAGDQPDTDRETMLGRSEPVDVQDELRRLRLDNDDLRFDRDRYRASAAEFQLKLLQALDELEVVRTFREDAEHLRHDIVVLAREFQDRRTGDRASDKAMMEERSRQAQDTFRDDLRLRYHERLAQETAGLSARLADGYAHRLRHEIVSLVNDYQAKLARQAAAREQAARSTPPPETDGDEQSMNLQTLTGDQDGDHT